jgi:lambda family phage portal protein
LGWINRIFGRRDHQYQVRAKIDAARSSVDTDRHWSLADSLSARASYTPEVRERVRRKARYECLNNSYAAGIVRTIAHHTIGTGPRVQILGLESEQAAQIERLYAEWCEQTGFNESLLTAKQSQVRDGEVFGIFTKSSLYDVPFAVRWIECDQCQSPFGKPIDTSIEDGVRLNDDGNPVEYHFLRHHPGGVTFSATLEGDWYPATQVIHYFRRERVGQVRGLSDLTPTLDQFAILRRYSRATLLAAETAANTSLYVKTTGPATTPASVGADMPTFDMQRNVMQFLPEGWEPFQLKPEHPATTHEMFVRATINEIARCLSMPYNIAACNSSGYNYSSGRLDHQTYYRSIEIDRSLIEARICNPVFRRWLKAAALNAELLGLNPDEIRFAWEWDGAPVIDEQADAAAGMARLQSGRSTLALEYQRLGYGDGIEQLRAGAAMLGMTLEQYQSAIAKSVFGIEPGAAASAVVAEAAASAPATGQFNTLSRRQWQNSSKAIKDVLTQYQADNNRVMALTLLQGLGISIDQASALLDDIGDNGVIDNQPEMTNA